MSPDARERPAQSSSGPTGATNPPSLQNSATPIPLPLPVIPDYEVLKRIGGGSYGDVWLARSLLGTWRAVKVVYRNSFEHDKPFEREFNGIQRFGPISLHSSTGSRPRCWSSCLRVRGMYKSECRRAKGEGNPKLEIRRGSDATAGSACGFRVSGFGFPAASSASSIT